MAGAAPSAPVLQLCFGSAAGELNLRVVQRRVAELIRVIDGLLLEMQSQGAHWTAFLDRLAVINMTHMQIMAEVRPLLRQYTVYPKYVDNPGIENCLPEMLASRLLPEQLEQEAAWRTQLPGGLAQLATQPNVCLDAADGQVVELQQLVGWLTNLQHVIKSSELASNPALQELPVGVLDPKGKLRREVDATSREIALAVSAAEAAREQAGGPLIAPQPQQAAAAVGQKRPRQGSQPAAQPAAGPVAVPSTQAEADGLIAQIMSGALWPAMRSG